MLADINNLQKNIIEMITKLIPTQNISYVKGGSTKNKFFKSQKYFKFIPKYDVEYGIKEIINFEK